MEPHLHTWIATIAALIAIFPALYAGGVITKSRELAYRAIGTVKSSTVNSVRFFSVLVIRFRIFLSLPNNPEGLIAMFRGSFDKHDTSRIAYFYMLTGQKRIALDTNKAMAAWAIALLESPNAALELINEVEAKTSPCLMIIRQRLEGSDLHGEELFCLQKRELLTGPIVDIAADLNSSIGSANWPTILDDIGSYLSSTPRLFYGFVAVRDANIIQPIDRKRLRALSRLCALKMRSEIIPRTALNLFCLSASIKRFD